jgi:hypothetical protein
LNELALSTDDGNGCVPCGDRHRRYSRCEVVGLVGVPGVAFLVLLLASGGLMDTADLIAIERANWWTAFRFMRAAGVAEPEKFLVRLPWRETGVEYVARVRKGVD